MNTGVGIRTIGVSRRASTSAINHALSRKPAANDRLVELPNSAAHVGRKRAGYAFRLKAVTNDSVLKIRDSAAHGDWKRAHHELVRLAKERAGLDWQEGRSLLSALRSQAHRKIGYASFEEYIERLFGYSPRFTKEKVRVAEALEVLTEMAQALKDGEICWSALREITRIVTPRTEAEWLRAARRRSVRQIERLVSGRKPGDGPDDPADEAYRRHVIRLEVTGATYATFRAMTAKLRRDSSEPLDDDGVVLMMARSVLGGPKDIGRSSYQIQLDVCERCRRGWQEARGEPIEVAPDVVEMAECDAQHIGGNRRRHRTRATSAPTRPTAGATTARPRCGASFRAARRASRDRNESAARGRPSRRHRGSETCSRPGRPRRWRRSFDRCSETRAGARRRSEDRASSRGILGRRAAQPRRPSWPAAHPTTPRFRRRRTRRRQLAVLTCAGKQPLIFSTLANLSNSSSNERTSRAAGSRGQYCVTPEPAASASWYETR